MHRGGEGKGKGGRIVVGEKEVPLIYRPRGIMKSPTLEVSPLACLPASQPCHAIMQFLDPAQGRQLEGVLAGSWMRGDRLLTWAAVCEVRPNECDQTRSSPFSRFCFFFLLATSWFGYIAYGLPHTLLRKLLLRVVT